MIKPEYLYRPALFGRRLLEAGGIEPEFPCYVDLTWGMAIRLPWDDSITRALYRRRIYDLPVSEVLWRLLDPGDLVVDVGANIGVFTGLAAHRAGEAGEVHAFEPHPRTYRVLRENVERWREAPNTGRIVASRVAVGSCPGAVVLREPDHFHRNRGTAYVEAIESGAEGGRDRGIPVEQTTLDQALSAYSAPDVIKLDVEGGEGAVIDGAKAAVGKEGARDIVYEAESESAAAVSAKLEDRGYTIFKIKGTWRGPRLAQLEFDSEGDSRIGSSYLPSSHLATRMPEQAVGRLRGTGWRCLRGSGK